MEKLMTRYRLGTALLSFIVAAFVVATLAPAAWPQTPELDPQALIGQWSGSWTSAHIASENGRYYLTITRVEGQKVLGKGEFVGKRTTEFKVNGTLSGNRLTYLRTELTISGNQMTGTGPDFKITLIKDK
jgi:hypothetical protein